VSGVFLTYAYTAGAEEHHSAQYLGVVGADGDAELALSGGWKFSSGEEREAIAIASRLGFGGEEGPWVALGFGGGRNVKMAVEAKSWPLERYRRLATSLESAGARVVWLGDNEDARRLGSAFAGINLAGRLSVPQTAAVLATCDLAIANDTMLLHLAGALEVPAIGLFGPTNPAHYRPLHAGSDYLWIGGDALPCSPCHRDGYYPPCPFEQKCMRDLSVESVVDKAKLLLRLPSATKASSAAVG
jgi:ADP-heptose:LPS heptosyltransferase